MDVASSRAYALSSCSAEWKPIEKVSTPGLCFAAIAATIELSRPPDRNTPTGTSATSRDATARSTIAARSSFEIARDVQHASVAVEDRERVHAVDAREQLVDSPAIVALREHFSVARSGEADALARERGAELAAVVDRAVLEREHTTAARGERLSAVRDGDHREPAHAERDATVDVDAFAVGPAMHDRVEHRAKHDVDSGRLCVDQACDAAHALSAPLGQARLRCAFARSL